jgi:hypothetical protein
MPHQSDSSKGALSVKKLAAALLLFGIAGFPAMAQEAQTLKERLSDKASDEQRVDNCRVPTKRRGIIPWLDCPAELRPPTPSAEASAAPAVPGAR